MPKGIQNKKQLHFIQRYMPGPQKKAMAAFGEGKRQPIGPNWVKKRGKTVILKVIPFLVQQFQRHCWCT